MSKSKYIHKQHRELVNYSECMLFDIKNRERKWAKVTCPKCLSKKNPIKKKNKEPRKLSFVKCTNEKVKVMYPSLEGNLLYLGEIPNMPGHCALVLEDGRTVVTGWHTDDFVELTVDET